MIYTRGTWINTEQLEDLKISFNKHSDLYQKNQKSSNKEFKSVLKLSSSFPIIIWIMMIIDIFINGNPLTLSGALMLMGVIVMYGIFIFLIWGMTRNPKEKYNHQEGLIKILEYFTSLCLKSQRSIGNWKTFYDIAFENKVINSIPKKQDFDIQNSNSFKIESDNIYTTSTWTSVQVLDNCILVKLTYKSSLTSPSFLLERNTTNNSYMILRRLLDSLWSWLIVVALYYIFIAEKCEKKVLSSGCKNDIDLLWFFEWEYVLYVLIIWLLFFWFWYIKTILLKEKQSVSTSDDDFDIFMDKWKVDDIPSNFLEEVKLFFNKHNSHWKNCKLFAQGNYIYVCIDRNIISSDNNTFTFLYKMMSYWMSKNSSEKEYVKKYIHYINFVQSTEKLWKKLRVYYT